MSPLWAIRYPPYHGPCDGAFEYVAAETPSAAVELWVADSGAGVTHSVADDGERLIVSVRIDGVGWVEYSVAGEMVAVYDAKRVVK